MATSNAFNSANHSRVLTTENSFNAGMQWTDNPLTEGYNKLLVNYILGDNGMSLKPRAGLSVVDSTEFSHISSADVCVHHTASALFLYDNELDSISVKYSLVGTIHTASTAEGLLGLPTSTVVANTARIAALYNGDYLFSSAPTLTGLDSTHQYYLQMLPAPSTIHGMSISNAARSGAYASFDNNTYCVCHEVYTDNQSVLHIDRFVAVLWFKFNNLFTEFSWNIKKLVPKDITAVQAVNYGYNMLKASPYSFTNSSVATGTLMLDGIIPKDSQGNIITSARLGEEITFNLCYRYPTSDATKQYLVSWELQDLSSDSESTVMLRSVRKSQAYTPGASITITTTQNTYKQFSLICKVYYKNVVDALEYESDVMDSVKLTPINTITLAYYYLSDDKATSAQNLGSPNYDVATATGMCTWNNRLVLWGVKGAESTLWISEVNDPTYFPYPNNIEIFDTPIISCVKYKSSLLVFTEGAIYQLTYGSDGITLTSKCIQERLTMSSEDASSIVPVQSLVHFKNGNYYYMIVPGQYASNQYGELMLAPITKPINELFDNFATASKYILDIANDGAYTYQLMDWNCYLEGNYIRECYKFKHVEADTDKYQDLVFQYDTKMRTWSVLLFESTQYRMTQYIQSVTSDSIFIMLRDKVVGGSTIELQFVQATPLSPVDNYRLNGALTQSQGVFHYIDTGYRALNELQNVKKKWREVRFDIVNHSVNKLQFLTEFRVDNDFRKGKYSYEYFLDETGQLHITPQLEDYDETESLQDILNWANAWDYNTAHFPDAPQHMVRVAVNAKGRLPRFRMADRNSSMFELRNIGYIYRSMTAR